MLPFSLCTTFKMDRIQFGIVFIVVTTIQLSWGSVPGTFFWKPRMAIDLAAPITGHPEPVRQPTKKNIVDGYVVLIDGYRAGMTVVAIAAVLDEVERHPHLDVRRASYYTNLYRWTLRYLSMLPDWFGGKGNYAQTHKVWRRRFFYMNRMVPQWMRNLLPFVDEKDWAVEAFELRKFNRYAEPAFGKHYRYPSKVFNNFKSELTRETIENMNLSKISVSGRG